MLIITLFSFSISAEITISSTYQRNKKVWGTYKQINEKSNRKKHNAKLFQSGDVILSSKGLVVIKSIESSIDSRVIVANFPYKRLKNRNYQISFHGQEEVLKDLYSESIKQNGYKQELVTFKSFHCKTYKNGKLNCDLQVQEIPTVALQD